VTGDLIERLIRGEVANPDGGPNLDVRVRSVVIEESLDGREADIVGALELGDELAVVTDTGTHRVLGERIERALEGDFSITKVSLGDDAHPDESVVDDLVERLGERIDALVAVGTGTINDVSKAVASRLDRPYVVFPTALSVNGYASATSSITSADGFKHSIPAEPPTGVFMDLRVLSGAPARLMHSGLGESLNRCTAQADWLLANLVRGTPYRSAPFELLKTEEDALFARAGALVTGDLAAVETLARSLVLAGMGMTLAGGSVSSSQGEHLISHYVDMMRPAGVRPAYHGEQIGVTAVLMAALQRGLLDLDAPPVLHPSTVTRDEVIAHFGERNGDEAWRELEPKLLDEDGARALTERVAARWDEIRARIGAALRPADELADVLRRAGAPVTPADLGWPDAFARDACTRAHQLRGRYTFLDLAAAVEPSPWPGLLGLSRS